MGNISSYFKATVSGSDEASDSRSIQIEVGPNLAVNDAVVMVSVLVNTLVKTYNAPLNDLLIAIMDSAIGIAKEQREKQKEEAVKNLQYLN